MTKDSAASLHVILWQTVNINDLLWQWMLKLPGSQWSSHYSISRQHEGSYWSCLWL